MLKSNQSQINTTGMAQLWGSLSKKVLSTVLTDPGAVFPIWDTIGPNPHWFPPRDRPVWRAVAQCVQENMPATVEAVATRTDASIEYIQAIKRGWTEEDARQVKYHAKELKRLGILAEVRDVGRELSGADDPSAADEIISYAVARLSGAAALQTDRRADANAVDEAAWDNLILRPGQVYPTGMTWFDNLAGGVWPGFNYWIVGAYKSGKTTMMRNWVINLARDGVPCDVFCAEGSREMFALDCQMMLATENLCEWGERSHHKLRLDTLSLRRYWGHSYFTQHELDAIDRARETWNTLNVRVWDTVDRIRNLATLRHRVQQSKFEFGATVFFLDYSQLFGDRGTIYERQSQTALTLQDIASSENVAFVILAQRNESAITSGTSDSYSPGVKGGGDGSAAADFLFMPKIDPDSPTFFNVKLKLSRHTPTGYGQHIINSSSGLLLDRWFGNNQANR